MDKIDRTKKEPMEIDEASREYIRYKLGQARESVEEAKGLLRDGAELKYAVNSVYYGFYYPVLGMLRVKGFPAAMQSVSLALFEKEYRESGLFAQRTFDAVRKAYDLKPKCSGGGTLTLITRQDVEALIDEAEVFAAAVSRIAAVA